jgi:hypothetical protein
MAPEQARSEKALTTAVDVHGLGAILYERLTGRPPFQAANPLDVLLQVMEQEPEPPQRYNPKAEVGLGLIARKCLEKNPAHRYESAAALADELDAWLNGEPIAARPVGRFRQMLRWLRLHPQLAAILGIVVFVNVSALGVSVLQEAVSAFDARALLLISAVLTCALLLASWRPLQPAVLAQNERARRLHAAAVALALAPAPAPIPAAPRPRWRHVAFGALDGLVLGGLLVALGWADCVDRGSPQADALSVAWIVNVPLLGALAGALVRSLAPAEDVRAYAASWNWILGHGLFLFPFLLPPEREIARLAFVDWAVVAVFLGGGAVCLACLLVGTISARRSGPRLAKVRRVAGAAARIVSGFCCPVIGAVLGREVGRAVGGEDGLVGGVIYGGLFGAAAGAFVTTTVGWGSLWRAAAVADSAKANDATGPGSAMAGGGGRG